ncbi:uncharacterized protein [Macaca nemestrina]|uniref:uncharacterized protein n=1 Tax=Macaca nemestrina TaxID=9545 RepID=UPI0039B9D109
MLASPLARAREAGSRWWRSGSSASLTSVPGPHRGIWRYLPCVFQSESQSQTFGGTRAKGRAPRRWRRELSKPNTPMMRSQCGRVRRVTARTDWWQWRRRRRQRAGRRPPTNCRPGGGAERSETCAALQPSSGWRPRSCAQSLRTPPPLGPAPARGLASSASSAPRPPARAGSDRYPPTSVPGCQDDNNNYHPFTHKVCAGFLPSVRYNSGL